MNTVYQDLEPAELWKHFDELNRIPRMSREEEAARAYVLQVAQSAGLETRTDAYGNCVVSVPGVGPLANAAPVCVQAHLDMVGVAENGVSHNFATDPIIPQRNGDWITATRTTLGADNGIGAAACLALATDTSITHGPLELLFTVEEEIGLLGASALDPALLTSQQLINLDSEDPREITIGCAGGETITLTLPITRQAANCDLVGRTISVDKLKGGHSGVEIHEHRANAIKILIDLLTSAKVGGIELQLLSVQGGSAHNAIPKDASASVLVSSSDASQLENYVESYTQKVQEEWASDEPNLIISIENSASDASAIVPATANSVLWLLNALPTGVRTMSDVFPGKVQTSANLATMRTSDDKIEIGVSLRSFLQSDIDNLRNEIEAFAITGKATLARSSGYPGWEPDANSTLLRITRQTYQTFYGTEPSVDVIHAGLECGVIAAKRPGMEAISFGPLIKEAHTPNECVEISSVAVTWKFLVALLTQLATE